MNVSNFTVVIPTSPIPIHPSTEIIEKVIASIRRQLPDAPIHILCDGVRSQMMHRRTQYMGYLERIEDLCSDPDANLSADMHEMHLQQGGMMNLEMSEIGSPFIFFCEHDATIDDKPIDWAAIAAMLSSGDANTVRLYWNSEPHPEHLHLMGERRGDFVKTTQWSSWPHVSRVDFYKRILDEYFVEDDCKMIETVMYSPVVESPWERFKTWIYCPEGDGVRFHHHDGRTDPKTGVRDPGEW